MKPLLLVLSALLYGIALCLPALHGGDTSVGGLVLLLFGWMQVIDGQCVAWMSNPLFLLALVVMRIFSTSGARQGVRAS